MANKNTLSVVFLVSFTVSFNLFIPITFLSVGLSTYGIIDKIQYYEYAPSSLSPIEKLNIKSDIGNININYVTPSVNFFAEIELHIQMRGLDVKGKDYSDYFDINWQTNNSYANLTLMYQPTIGKSEIESLIDEITISVSLRADILFDINVSLIKGNVDISMPYMVSINNLSVETNDGDIYYDFNHCILRGNILGSSLNGNFIFRVENIQCTQNIFWNLTSQNGELDFYIRQKKDLGANITGSMSSKSLNLTYLDHNDNVEALFTFPNSDPNLTGDIIIGFDDIKLLNGGDNGYQLKSSKFPEINNYNLIFNVAGKYKLNVINNQPYN